MPLWRLVHSFKLTRQKSKSLLRLIHYCPHPISHKIEPILFLKFNVLYLLAKCSLLFSAVENLLWQNQNLFISLTSVHPENRLIFLKFSFCLVWIPDRHCITSSWKLNPLNKACKGIWTSSAFLLFYLVVSLKPFVSVTQNFHTSQVLLDFCVFTHQVCFFYNSYLSYPANYIIF